MTPTQKLAALRGEMRNQAVDILIVPRQDEFQGEYVPASAERLAWLTGFTGSAGTAVILADTAAVFTDSRYERQIVQETDAGLYRQVVTRNAMDDIGAWILSVAKEGQKLGYDPKLHTEHQLSALKKALRGKPVALVPLDRNLVDTVWADRPPPPLEQVRVFSDEIAGRSARDKSESLAATLLDQNIDAVILTMPDSIAWLLNIRGNDVPHTPFALANAIAHADGRIDWFIDAEKITPEVRAHLGNRVQIVGPETLESALAALQGKTVRYDPLRSSIWFRQMLERAGSRIVDGDDPCVRPKARKTPEELAGMRAAHLRDAVAMVNLLHWFDNEAGKGLLSELDVVAKLDEFCRAQPDWLDTSFDTIAGWQSNGAIVHYHPKPETNKAIKGSGILLLDSGRQYVDGTTDITRTIAVGDVDDEKRQGCTAVLKGHIQIASLRFPKGLRGHHLDGFARRALWDLNLDYGHGTGHGVGCNLSVHEEGFRLSLASDALAEEGNIVSNEPGVYLTFTNADGSIDEARSYGCRIESLLAVRDAGVNYKGDGMFEFETLTLVPIDRRLIVKSMLTAGEIAWLNAYHDRVRDALLAHLDPAAQDWLRANTAPL